MNPEPFVSILMLTHNAPDYVRIAVESIHAKTASVGFELIVVDNGSEPQTQKLLRDYDDRNLIDQLILNEENLLFAAGNNLAARYGAPDATHFLLINSDVEVVNPNWLRHLLDLHTNAGITTYGYVASAPRRVDGYCLLINVDVYRRFGGLDEGHQWWWSVTKLQAEALVAGYVVKGYYEHGNWLVHFGGKSGDSFKSARGMDISREAVTAWFQGLEPVVLDPENLPENRSGGMLLSRIWRRVKSRLR